MIYYITKTGLDIFDLCRAYGMAVLIDNCTPEEGPTVLIDAGSHYLIENKSHEASRAYPLKNNGWQTLLAEASDSGTWKKVFLTDKQNWQKKKVQVEKIFNENADDIIKKSKDVSLVVRISSSSGETLPGPLDPSAFKGLRGKTRGDYAEAQTKVDQLNWALACLGATISASYKVQKSPGNKFDYYVIFPVPQKVELSNFRNIKATIDTVRYRYISIQNAAAHFSVCIARKMKELLASKSQFSDRFSGVFYFSMVQTGRQFKPASGGSVSLNHLMELVYSGNPEVDSVFNVWNYLFQIGSKQGNEDLALAITDFIMHPTIETYERHVRIFLRYLLNKNKKLNKKNVYAQKSLMEVTKYVR